MNEINDILDAVGVERLKFHCTPPATIAAFAAQTATWAELAPNSRNNRNSRKAPSVKANGEPDTNSRNSRNSRRPPLMKTHMDAADLRELYEERAAIMQYDGGLPRPEAERRAWLIVIQGVN